ncbi:anti-sigma factor domain-containing protein [Thermoflexus sp.]|uniref:anti-sigma factor n=1 Tax=Thermoflexus sp. TaxID=1969742 RepID=UPI001756C5AE|nr:anti-sigma factor [Thermoflexus sp.]
MNVDHEVFQEELAAYALGALPPEEAAAVAAHMAGCPACREAVARYREAATALAYTVPLQPPPPRLKARLMARVRRPQRENWRWLGMGAALVIATLLLILAAPRIFAPPLSVTPRVIPLQGAEAAPEAEGYLILEDGQGLLVTKGLAVPPEGQVYQVWFVDAAGRRVSGGTFRTHPRLYGVYTVTVPLNLPAYVRIGVTLEPEGGSPQPTGPQALRGSLRSSGASGP